MICKSCGLRFSELLPLCPYCAAPREPEARADAEKLCEPVAEPDGGIAVAVMTAADVIEEAEAAGKSISVNLDELAAKTKVTAKAAGNSFRDGMRKTSASLGQKFDDIGGFRGIAYRFKRLLFFILRIIRFIINCIAREFRNNYDSPKFWVYIGVVAVLVLIIIVK